MHHSGHNQLTAIQRWPDYTVEPVYSGHPSGHNQLAAIQMCTHGLIIQWNLCIVVTTPQDPTSWLLYRGALPDYTMEPVYSGDHPSGPNQLAAIQRCIA